MNRPLVLLVVAAALLFGLFTTYEHVAARGLPYLEADGTQFARLQTIMAGKAGNPVQYRVLTAYLLALAIKGLSALAVPHPILLSFIGLRIVEDTAIFALAFAYYRALGLSVPNSFVALSLLAWGMSYGHYNADLRFDTYLDVSFYLLAALFILAERYVWIVPLTLLAALNRETSGLIPFLLLAQLLARSAARSGRPRLSTREATLVGAALACYVAVFVGLRSAYPEQSLRMPNVAHQGLDLLAYNLGQYSTWVQLFAAFGILPALALVGYRRWPAPLRAFGWTIVPLWFAIHALGAIVAETRLFLVPQALVIVPGAIFLAQSAPSDRLAALDLGACTETRSLVPDARLSETKNVD